MLKPSMLASHAAHDGLAQSGLHHLLTSILLFPSSDLCYSLTTSLH